MDFPRSARDITAVAACVALVAAIMAGVILVSAHSNGSKPGSSNAAPHSQINSKPASSSSAPLVIVPGPVPSFVRNFNPFAPNPLQPTLAGVYEPLYIVSYVNHSKVTPWLATSYAWSKDLKTLTFTIRHGVKWSDGKPFTASDVAFTLNLGKKNVALDKAGLWGARGLGESVTMSGNTVSIHYKKVDVSTFASMVNNVFIVPQHIWSKVKDPINWTNPDPVGTGPYTQIHNFSSQSYDLSRNPHYWQAAKVKVNALRYPAYNGNDSATLDVAAGKVDWGGLFIPRVEQVYVARDPKHYHYFYSTASVPAMLYLNTTAYPYSLPAFRQALSKAINRQALQYNAEYGYEPPAHITGLNGLWPNWIDKSVSNSLAQYNASTARTMLESAGFKVQGGKLIDPHGHTVSFDINVPAGWTDWIAASQIMAQNFRALGIAASLHPLQFGDYYDRLQRGNFVTAMSWSTAGATPYTFYDTMLGSEYYQPVGTLAPNGNNFGRWQSGEMDQVFEQFRRTTDSGQQHALVNRMQQVFVANLPYIPLMIGALWSESNTQRYTGFPTPSNTYASPAPYTVPDRLLVFTHLRPSS
jgi:peptide/nickel transport system substrate-binding protein